MPHFADKKAEAQKSSLTIVQGYSWKVARCCAAAHDLTTVAPL